MKEIFRNTLPFLIVYFVFLIPSILLIIVFSKGQIHLSINKFHSNFFDFFFLHITFLGSGFAAIITAIIILILLKLRYFLITSISFISSSLFVQFLKRVIFREIDDRLNFSEMLFNYILLRVKRFYDIFLSLQVIQLLFLLYVFHYHIFRNQSF